MAGIARRTDHDLRFAITTELSWTPGLISEQIGVAVTDGGVTLSGEVGTYAEKKAAVEAALRVHGVTAIADEIGVSRKDLAQRNDADLARDAGNAIDRIVGIPADSVKATVHDYVVTLTGTVSSESQREAARRAVAFLPGVQAVHDLIHLEPQMTVDPVQAREKITAALMRTARLDTKHIDVRIDGHHMTLSGTVSSSSERREAEHAAWALPGVTLVTNHIAVVSDLD